MSLPLSFWLVFFRFLQFWFENGIYWINILISRCIMCLSVVNSVWWANFYSAQKQWTVIVFMFCFLWTFSSLLPGRMFAGVCRVWKVRWDLSFCVKFLHEVIVCGLNIAIYGFSFLFFNYIVIFADTNSFRILLKCVTKFFSFIWFCGCKVCVMDDWA